MADRREAVPENVLGFLEDRRDELVGFASELVATPSMNPPGDERAVADLVRRRLHDLGVDDVRSVAQREERPNLFVRLQGRGGGPTLLWNGHMDTKPVTEQDRLLWDTDPLHPVVWDGQLYGLGSTDMKGSLAAMVYAAGALRQLPTTLRGDLLLTFVADEETPAGFGTKYLVSAVELPADFALVCEPSGIERDFEMLPLFCRGTLYFKTKVHGTQMHASVADRYPAVNASSKMAWVLWRMSRDLRLSHTPHPHYPTGPTITPGVMVSGGVYLGVHPGYAEFATDVRLLPGMTHERALTEIEAFLEGLRREDPDLRAEVEVIGGVVQAALTGDEPFVGILGEVSREVLGREVPLGGHPAYTDAYWLHAHSGIPTVPAFGPGLLPLAHSPNEHVSVEAIVAASKIYALSALRYLSGETTGDGS